jgi:hypothetical protein
MTRGVYLKRAEPERRFAGRVWVYCSWLVALMTAVPASALYGQSEVPAAIAGSQRQLIVVTGVGGAEEYRRQFLEWSNEWIEAGRSAGFRVTEVTGDDADRPALQQLEAALRQSSDVAELWLVLIGHGTFDGEVARFNLVGADLSARQLGEWLNTRESGTVIVNCASASAPFVSELAGENRVIVTATKSGYESSFARFGKYLAEAITRTDIDLDKDQQTSLLEAVIYAAATTAEFYDAESRLATEHALIEDNGDGRGTPVEWFRGIRVTRQAEDGTSTDGRQANQVFFAAAGGDHRLDARQLRQRDELEQQIEDLRGRKSDLGEDQYYRKLEEIMVQLARLYQAGADR